MKSVLLLSFVFAFGTCNAQNTSLPEGKRFNVDDVKIAPGPLTEMKAQFTFESELRREVLFFPDELKNEKVVPAWGNNFVATIHTSFDEHRPLSLTPDAVWLAIAQGISIHINENFDELESHIFKSDKPDRITVRNDNLTEGSVHWVDLMHAFSDSTTKYVNDDYYSFFVPEFSTTTNIHMTSYEVTMLEGFSQAFEYFGDSGCGIPYITLQGRREDWQSIYNRLDKIEELGMILWAKELRSVIQQFIHVFDDNIDLDFWQSIYKDHSEYGAWYVSGWFIKFFPYLEGTGKRENITEESMEYYARAPKVYVPNNYLEGDRYLISRLNTSDFPSGMSEITVHWNNWGTDQEMKVHAGFYGIKQYDDLSLEPAIAWAVRDENASEANHDYTRKRYEIEKQPVYWLPDALSNDRLKEFAVYGSTSQSDSLESNLILEIKILTALEKNASFSEDNLKGKTVEFLISSEGTFLECRGEGVDPSLLDEIAVIVKNLPKKWEPAKADFREFVYDFYDEEDDGRIVLVPANSWYKLTF